MSPENLEIAKAEYQAGKQAFECGEYRQSVQHLEKASSLVARNSRLGGEVQIWLVTAYEAAGQRPEAIALCNQLIRHPDTETRKQVRRLRYILEAPKLETRPEWLIEIPDLAALAESDPQDRRGTGAPTPKKPQKRSQTEPIDLSQVNTRDNAFIWIALIAIALILGGLLWFS